MKAAIWIRVSTAEQEAENQLIRLQEYAEVHEWTVATIYRVEESAWRGKHLKWLTTVYEDARAGKFNTLLVWSIDRLSRQGIGAIFQIIERLEGYGVKVVSLQESWTQENNLLMRDMLLAVTAWVARFESERQSERTKAGVERARRGGSRIGRPSIGSFIDLELVVRFRQLGRSWREIAATHPRTIRTPSKGTRRPSAYSLRMAYNRWVRENGVGEIVRSVDRTESSA